MPRHKLTKEENSKGGKTVTERKRISNSLKTRKRCSESCPLFPCAVAHLSRQTGGSCAFKMMPKELQERSLNLLLGGKEGAVKEFVNTLNRIITLSERRPNSVTEQRKVFHDMERFLKTVYGDKISHVIEEPVEIRIRWMDEEEAEEDG